MANVAFDISSALYTDGGSKALTPDANGVYKAFPVMVLGKTSRNGKNYDVESMVFAITNPSSVFYKKLHAGQLQGEYGHPFVTEEKDLARIAMVDPTKVSHVIHRVYCSPSTERGNTIVYADIQPFGPYGKYLDESLKSPHINTAFSLRSLVAQTGTNADGSVNQRVTALITIDAVDAPGYAEASKVYVPSTEGYTVVFKNPETIMKALAGVMGCEDINDQQLLDILQVNKVSINHKVCGILNSQGKYVNTGTGKISVFHELF